MKNSSDKLVIVESELRRRAKLDDLLSGAEFDRVPTSNLLTLPRFFSSMITRADIPSAVPDWLRYVAMRAAAGLDPDSSVEPVFSDHARPSRLVRRLLSIRYELGMARISSDQLREANASRSDSSSSVHHELPGVLERYLEKLEEEQVADRPGQMERLIAVAENRSHPPAPYEQVRTVEIHGLGRLRELEFQLLASLLQNVERATVEFSYNPDREEAFSWVLPTVEKFERAGLALDTVDPAFRIPDEPRDSALYDVRNHIFREPDQLTELDPIPPDESLRFVETNHPGVECRAVANIVRQTLENGTPPDEIAVVHGENDNRHAHLIHELTSVDVPVLRREEGFSTDNPGIQTLFLPIDTAFNGFDRDDVLDLLRNHLLGGPADIDDDGLDDVFREAGITDGPPDTWRSRLDESHAALNRRLDAYENHSPDRSFFPRNEEQEQKLYRDLNRFLDRMDPLFDVLSEGIEARSLTELVYELQHTFNTFDLSSSLVRTNVETSAGRRIYRAVSAFRSFLDRLHSGLQHVDVRSAFQEQGHLISFLKQIWNDADSRREKWRGPSDGVRVLTPRELTGMSLKNVILVGMNEGQWPSPVHDDAFLNDDLIMELRRVKGRSVLRTTSGKRTRDLYRFHQVLSAAEEQVTFTWSRMDSGGTELIPSPFLEDVKKLLAEFPVQQIDPSNREDQVFHTVYSDRDRLIRTTSGEQRSDDTDMSMSDDRPGSFEGRIRHVLDRQRLDDLRDRFFMEPDAEKRSEKAGPWSGVLSGQDRFRELLTEQLDGFDTQRWSSTALERYAQCPYAYFSERILELEEREQPTLGMDRRREGLLLHEILRRIYGEERSTSTPVEDARIYRVCEKMFDRWEHYGFEGDPTFWQIKRERLKIRVRKIVKYLERNRTEGQEVRTEQAFGRDQSLPPIKLSDPEQEPIYLEGRIDRLELRSGENGAVFDYKNARKRQKYREFTRLEEFGRRSFQIPMYLLAAARSSIDRFGTVKSWEAGFLTLREQRQRPEVSETLVSRESGENELEDIRERLREGTEQIVDRILNGHFEVTPNPCRSGCPYRNMCRYEKMTSEEQ